MKLFLAEYAQRLLLSMFLVAFGLYLLVATLTYTPFDPGWTHLSSDTQSVTNATGVAGAWIADLLYGFLGRAALLVPLVLLLEVLQLWWPHSFVTRPFRLAAQLFLIVAVAALCSLHVYEPADTLSNASGGIIGYELAGRLLALMNIWLVTAFLLSVLLLMMTLAFGIQWSRTLEMLGRLPPAIAALFARQPVDEFEPIQQALPLQASDDFAQQSAELPPQPIQPAQQPAVIPSHAAQTATHATTTHTTATPQPAQSALHLDSAIPPTIAAIANVPAEFGQAAVLPSALPDSTAQRISPAFNWQDQDVFQELLQAVPTHPVAAASVSASPDPFDLAFSSIDAALKQPVVAEVQPEPATVAPEPKQPIVDVAQPLDAEHDPLQITPSAHAMPPQQVLSEQPASAPISQPMLQSQPQPVMSSFVPHDQADVSQDDAFEDWAQPDDLKADDFESDDVDTDDVGIHVRLPDDVASTAQPYQQSTALQAVESPTRLANDADESEPEQPAALKITTLDPTELEDFDAPLTDASGRIMSRSMQVAAHRATLSPLPSLDLLDLPDPDRKPSYTPEELSRLSELLEIKLLEFNIKGQVIEAQPGPVVTRFEVELAAGVKASKVTNISKDLARSMSMASVRVVEVIPGKPYIGIEVPNQKREMVRLIELLRVPAYRDPAAMLSMAMGKDIAGRPVLADLAKAPHMLVAGTTGSGKSVAVNAMLLSMLLKYNPQQLRLILIDPKQLELANYGDIPHLLTPVVTDMKDAVNALNWCVGEMERRYKLMTLFKVRKIDEFNRKVIEAEERGEDLLDPLWKASDSAVQDRPPRLKTLPLIVIVADEFADMIMQIGKKAEELITRLAQKSRAAGIHLMLATQRPSVDVITGLIKANIPTRVALRVNSKIDSRTILDAGGAEDMLGHGDMLFLGPGKIEPERVHGAFISDDEVNRICDAWRERGSPDYVDDILTPFDEDGGKSAGYADSGGGDGADSGRDPMFDQVVAFVLETKKVSASSIQRKFSLGYNRAARIVDQMEDAGIVSPMGSSGKRDVMM